MKCMNCTKTDLDATYTCPECDFTLGSSDGSLVDGIITRLREAMSPLSLQAVLEIRKVLDIHLQAVQNRREIVDDISTLPFAPMINSNGIGGRIAIGNDRIYFQFRENEITVLPTTPQELLTLLQERQKVQSAYYTHIIFEDWLDGTPSVNFFLSALALAFGQNRCDLAFVPYDALIAAVQSAINQTPTTPHTR